MARNIARIAMVLLTVMCLWGCSNGKKYEDDDVKDIINATTQSADRRYPNFDFDSNENPYNGTYGPYKQITEDGYYDMIGEYEYDAKNEYYRYQAYGYYDLNTDTLTPLCSKPYCTHETRECEAMFATVHFHDTNYMGEWETWHISSNLIYYKHRLYTLYYDEKNGSKVVSYDATGGDMKTEIILEKDPRYIITRLSEIKDGKVYGTTYTIDESGKYVYYINEWDLKTGKKKQLFERDRGQETNHCYANKISDGKYEINYSMSINGKKLRLIYDEKEGTYTEVSVEDNTIKGFYSTVFGIEYDGKYYFVGRKSKDDKELFYSANISTGEIEQIELGFENDKNGLFICMFRMGDYIFINTADSKYSEDYTYESLINNDLNYNRLYIYNINNFEQVKAYEIAIYDDISTYNRGDALQQIEFAELIERLEEEETTYVINALAYYKIIEAKNTINDPRFCGIKCINDVIDISFEVYFDVDDINNGIIDPKVRNLKNVTEEDVKSFIKELK